VALLPPIPFQKAFVDGPSTITGVVRQAIPFKRLSLTDIVIPIQRSPRLKALTKAFQDAKVLEKWEKTAWAKKQAVKSKRASLNDFDRFKVMLGKQEVSCTQVIIFFSFFALYLLKLIRFLAFSPCLEGAEEACKGG
jgi:large subunit ribosomal protein L14e